MEQERGYEEYYENKENNSRNVGCLFRYLSKAKDTCDNGDDKKNQYPVQHS